MTLDKRNVNSRKVYTVHILKALGTTCNCEFWLKLRQTVPNHSTHVGEPGVPEWEHAKAYNPYGICTALNTLQEARPPKLWAQNQYFKNTT